MADKKRTKRRKDDQYTGPEGKEEVLEKPTKDEYKIAKWMKSNVPTKKTKFLNHNVIYFSSSKALDALMQSKFAQGDGCLLPTREVAIEFLDSMLVHKFFHRAKKVPVTEAELRRGKKLGDKEKSTKDKDKDKTDKEKVTDAESSQEGKDKDKEKKKRKIRLDMHPEQVFVDGSEAYVWIYDPIPMHYWLFGALLVIGAIGICMFPLWPQALRKVVYYSSIAGAGFLVFILSLIVIRFIVFCIIWVLSGAKHHFWLFPNLTEDVGFFESFWPIYMHEFRDGLTPSGKDKKKKRKKDKDSDAEDETNNSKVETIATTSNESKDENINNENVTQQHNTPSESESESSQRSSIDKEFEMVDAAEVETS